MLSKRLFLPLILFSGAGLAGWASAGDEVSFTRDVQPLLEARCNACHGAQAQKNGLRLDLRQDALEGGDTGPAIVPGKGAESELVRRVLSTDASKRMPPTGPSLTKAQADLLKRWIDEGASYGGAGSGTRPPAKAGADTRLQPANGAPSHWAFRPIRSVQTPAGRNPIDFFIRKKLSEKKLNPSPAADRPTLIRRLSLDLLGLPPTPEEVDAFTADKAPGAYERLVDRLLASPHFGERWGRHWLDRARYSDSNGYTIDSPRSIWPYRDWVIRALNADMPFDRFTIEQIAGDLLPNATREQLVATGFHRNTMINEEGGTDPEQFRIESVVDRVATTGTVWLGLSIACAQCHSHKYDPISQREYYRFFAFLNNADEPTLNLGTPDQGKALEEAKKAVDEALAVQKAYEAGPQRTPAGAAEMVKRVEDLKTRLRDITNSIPTTMIVRERAQPRDTFVHIRGDFLRHGARVAPAVPAVLNPLSAGSTVPNRLDFAQWLVDPANPLTARVTVNWIWQQLFGAGIVGTENDFGLQGERPTHPELLDFLADSLKSPRSHAPGPRGDGESNPAQTAAIAATVGRRNGLGWSIKSLLRLMVTSDTYRQSSKPRPELLRRDPANRLLARQSRIRLEAEIIRDSALKASGLLTERIGGPSVYPPQPEGIDLFTQNKKNWTASKGEDRYRRGMYTFNWRSNPYPLFTTLDAPAGTLTCTRRVRSNTPTQALMLANDASLVELARGLSTRMLAQGPSDRERIVFGFRACLSRTPTEIEISRLERFLKGQFDAFQADASSATQAAGHPMGQEPARAAAWVALARVLMNLDEFITRE